MVVLAVESDPTLAASVRHVVCGLLKANVTLVDSIDRAVQTLRSNAPDVVLLPALVSPAEETQLLESLRTLPDCDHVEVLLTPRLEAPGADETRLFAERLGWSLQRVRKQKQLAEQARATRDETATGPGDGDELLIDLDELSQLLTQQPPAVEATPIEVPAPATRQTPDLNRRTHTRFLGSELRGLRTARIERGPDVALLDLSAGGALIETVAELPAGSEAVLELVGEHCHMLVPFRVVRSGASGNGDSVRYREACAFMRPLDPADLMDLPPFDDALRILEEFLPSLQREQLVELLGTLRSHRQPSNPLEREALELLNIALSAPERKPRNDEPAGDPSERRRFARVSGPFDGLRLGAIETPVVIRDLSEGGCFVDSLVEAKPGRQLSIGVLVPGEEWITATAEVVRGQPGFGYALRFIDPPEATRTTLARVVAARRKSGRGATGPAAA